MYEGQTVGVVIPAYEEADHVASVVSSIPVFVDRIYAIDDASTDDTWNEINRITEEMNGEASHATSLYSQRVVPIQHTENRGAGGAVITGYEYARADGIDVIAVMDGDGQMDPSELERIVEPVASGEVGYAKGNRLLRSADRSEMSRWRLFGNALLTMLTRVASGYWDMSDPQNGFTALSSDALDQLPMDRLYRQYGFLNDVLIHLNMNRTRIADVPHRGKYGNETSGIKYRSFIPGLSILLARRFFTRLTRMYLIRRFHPLVFGYILGIMFTVWGVLSLGFAIASTSFLGTVLGGLMIATGCILLLLGMVSDVHDNEGLVITRTAGVPSVPDRMHVQQLRTRTELTFPDTADGESESSRSIHEQTH